MKTTKTRAKKMAQPRKARALRAAPQPLAVGQWAQFDSNIDDAMGEVVFCDGDYVVVRQADGTCEGGPAHQVARHGPISAPGRPSPVAGAPRETRWRLRVPVAGSPREPAAMFQKPLQTYEPLPLMAFVERLVRIQSDLCTLVEAADAEGDEVPAELLIEGRRVKIEDVVALKNVHKKIEECVQDMFYLLETSLHGHLADEWHGSRPVTPLFQGAAAAPASAPVGKQ